ncbi:MAG: DUF1735 domain-containing protein [Muribaculaceae bacterium]|nr:DUF1735 domain-containing protein [Muribaculaceae bacterium]
MKNKLYISLFAAAAFGFASCESDIDNYMVDDTVGFLTSGLVETEVYPGVDATFEIYAVKAGKGFNSATASIVVDPEVITEYNGLSTTKQAVSELPSDCYTIKVASVTLTNADYRMPFVIDWNVDKLEAALAEDPNQVVPLRMSVQTEGKIAENRLTALVQPAVAMPSIELAQNGMFTGVEPTRASLPEEDVYFNVNANFIAQEDIVYNIEVDPSLLDEYNESHSSNYVLLPEEAYVLEKSGTIKQHLSNDMFKMTFKRTVLIPEDGPSKFGDYVLPIRLTSNSNSYFNSEKDYVLYRISVKAVEISKAKWEIIECNATLDDEPTVTDKDRQTWAVTKLIDGDKASFWRTPFSTDQTLPYYFVIDLGQDRDLQKLEAFVPSTRADKPYGNNKAGYVEVSMDNETWKKVADWSCTSNGNFTVQLEPCTARYVKFVITEVLSNNNKVKNVDCHNATALSEITLWGE